MTARIGTAEAARLGVANAASQRSETPMSPKNADRLGRLADELDAVLFSAKMPVAPKIHLDALVATIRAARDVCASIVREETGDDPWETNPLEG